MSRNLFLGTYPGLTQKKLNQEIALIHCFVQAHE
jgi:hypothetical protein